MHFCAWENPSEYSESQNPTDEEEEQEQQENEEIKIWVFYRTMWCL